MKDIIIFEDSLENAITYVKQLEQMKDLVSEIYILLYCTKLKKANDKIESLKNRFSHNVHMELVTLWDYEEKLDEFYKKNNTIFLFDTDLHGDGSTVFNNRINVMYAKKKMKNGEKCRIWFYTIAQAEQRAVLLEQFPYNTLSVADVGREGIVLNFNEMFFNSLRA